MTQSTDARRALLDTAERLFAQHGIDSVSDRRVAQEAGNTNHSAVAYYFGGRDGLLQELISRHLGPLEPDRRARLAASDSLLGDVRALVLPTIRHYAELPTPSWRARFVQLAMTNPVLAGRLQGFAGEVPAARAIFDSIIQRLDHLDPTVVQGRARLMTHLVRSACADIEAQAERSGVPARWDAVGDFLCDAIGGMLQAPVSGAEAVVPPLGDLEVGAAPAL